METTILNKLRKDETLIQQTYQTIVNQSRSPLFYTDFLIPDTPMGRFESLSLHLFLILRRLKEETDLKVSSLEQGLCNLFVADMDHCLRDIKISEKTIDRQFKKIVEGFYGRLVSYDQAIDSETSDNQLNLVEKILKNVYDNNEIKRRQAEKLATYCMQQLIHLRQQQLNNLQFLQDFHYALKG